MGFPPQGAGISRSVIEDSVDKSFEKERAKTRKYKYLSIILGAISVMLALTRILLKC